jgi:hypothetical protein
MLAASRTGKMGIFLAMICDSAGELPFHASCGRIVAVSSLNMGKFSSDAASSLLFVLDHKLKVPIRGGSGNERLGTAKDFVVFLRRDDSNRNTNLLPAHCAAGATTTPDGRRMSVNVEIPSGSLMVQHYVEEIGEPDHLRLVSISDLLTPTGRTKVGVIWDLSVKKIDDQTCEFTNRVHSFTTPEFMDFLGKQGIPFEVFQTARKPISEAHNRLETLTTQKASNVTP